MEPKFQQRTFWPTKRCGNGKRLGLQTAQSSNPLRQDRTSDHPRAKTQKLHPKIEQNKHTKL